MNMMCRCGSVVLVLLVNRLVLCSVGCSVLLNVWVRLVKGLFLLEFGCFIYMLLNCCWFCSVVMIGVMWLVVFSCGSLVSIISFCCVKMSECYGNVLDRVVFFLVVNSM